jgi:3-isopropylmalate dehydratase small subunit
MADGRGPADDQIFRDGIGAVFALAFFILDHRTNYFQTVPKAALMDFGIRAVVASSFSDIFAGNAFKNGLLAARVDPLAIVCLLQLPETAKIRIDLGAQSIEAAAMPVARFDIDPFQRECLMRGVDEIELTLGLEEEIRRYEMLVSSGQGGMSLA